MHMKALSGMPNRAWATVRPPRYPSPARPDRPAVCLRSAGDTLSPWNAPPPTLSRRRHRPARKHKTLAERALAQVRDEDLFLTLDPESNSLAIWSSTWRAT